MRGFAPSQADGEVAQRRGDGPSPNDSSRPMVFAGDEDLPDLPPASRQAGQAGQAYVAPPLLCSFTRMRTGTINPCGHAAVVKLSASRRSAMPRALSNRLVPVRLTA